MPIGRKIRLLIVDDSIVFREVLAQGISCDPRIEVVAKAIDPFDARDKILQYKPDVMTCDVEMPKMNGLEFLKRLLPQYPIPVIVVSTVGKAVFDAMDAGAVDFVSKPDVRSGRDVHAFIDEMISKIIIASQAKVTLSNPRTLPNQETPKPSPNMSHQLIAIGASTGGIEAISTILKALPPTMPGIVIVQHIPPIFSKMFAERLNSALPLLIKEAASGDIVGPGRVLVAPGDQHLRIKKLGDQFRVECFKGEKVNGHCPSVDVLFNSVAKEAGKQALGVILTGMGYDGAKGLLMMRRNGARTLGQDETSSVVYGMPRVAHELGAVERQLPLNQIAPMLCSLLR